MKTVSLKLENTILAEMDSKLHEHRYSTRTEFIRDAIRKKLSDLEKERMIKAVAKAQGISKRKTTDEDLHRARKKLVAELEAKFKKK